MVIKFTVDINITHQDVVVFDFLQWDISMTTTATRTVIILTLNVGAQCTYYVLIWKRANLISILRYVQNVDHGSLSCLIKSCLLASCSNLFPGNYSHQYFSRKMAVACLFEASEQANWIRMQYPYHHDISVFCRYWTMQ